MSTVLHSSPGVDRLAQRLEEEILNRQLCAGDRFMTSDAAGKRFGVSRATAHRAFQHLVNRELLVSRRRQGTFVGPASPYQRVEQLQLKRVHGVIDPERLRAGLSTGELVEGLRAALPEHDVRINYLSAANASGYMTTLLREIAEEQAESDRDPCCGLVLFGCPRPVQEIVAASEVPAVIFGSRYPTAASIPSISVDNVAKGRVLTQYLLDRGHKKIGAVMRETWLPGDRRVFEGISQQLAEAELPYGTLSIRNVPADENVIATELSDWFRGDDAPTALICQQRFAEAVTTSLRQLEKLVPKGLEVVVETTDHRTSATLDVPHTRSQIAFFERVKRAGEILARLLDGETLDSTEILPIELFERSES